MTDREDMASQLKMSKQDDSIMGTNNSSIVSKRSVERLYYPDEPHFFRYFVKKPQRRAPLINRGYWLRMKAIEHVVRQFLEEPSDKPKIVMNLGCGYDPNPWQCLSRYPKVCETVTFIDIDYMALMEKKRDVVKSTPELKCMLSNVRFPESGRVLLQSDQYLQVGCDLRELSELSAVLTSAVDIEKCLILCTAEVSITYMKVEAADALVKWTSELLDARFCLLEQTMPEGPHHPFAQTMMAHFEKLNTPIRAVSKYPTIADQKLRFRNFGWKNVEAMSLWELWSRPEFLSSTQRIALDGVEPFDEWEEFALFACHYFILTADKQIQRIRTIGATVGHNNTESLQSDSIIAKVAYAEYEKSQGCRRFGASLPVRGLNRKRDLIGNFGGMGLQTRLSSYDVYVSSSIPDQLFHQSHLLETPLSRMCHTITDLGDAGAFLVGGRSSPDKGLVDCWLHHKWTNTWERVDDLPIPRYRHSAVAIGGGSVLVAGGKCDSRTILNDFCFWSRRCGWVECATQIIASTAAESGLLDLGACGDKQPAIFGGMLGVLETSSSVNQSTKGILVGGIGRDGLVAEEIWIWTLHMHRGNNPAIILRKSKSKADVSVARFGATMLDYSGRFLIVGGVIRDIMLTTDEWVVISDVFRGELDQEIMGSKGVHFKDLLLQPLLIGSSVSLLGDTVVITGGGAVCFSFGTFWNRGCFTLSLQMVATKDDSENCDSQNLASEAWRYLQTVESIPSGKQVSHGDEPSAMNVEKTSQLVTIQRKKISSTHDFPTLVSLAQPVIIEGLDLGTCTSVWTSTYLQDQIARDTKVVVHEASTEHMDFASKNFRYVTKSFGVFMEAVDTGERLYLRSLSAEKPSEQPANLKRDFPKISNDFRLPPELKVVGENLHSSALRISGPVNMWLHYDVMANILCQIRGNKRLLLFPPSDVSYFQLSPGASSSSIDAFDMLNDVKLSRTHPHEAILRPGDVLFLPALWLHTASPMEGVSIAVNVFFRNLKSGYAPGKDVYGNRDLQAYERGRHDVARIIKSFRDLPKDACEFYVSRLAEELKEMVGY